MSSANALKQDLDRSLLEFSQSDDIENPKTAQRFDEAGIYRAGFRARIDFAARVESRLSTAIIAMQNGDREPIDAISRELDKIGVELEFSTDSEGNYQLGDPVNHVILLFRGKLEDRLK